LSGLISAGSVRIPKDGTAADLLTPSSSIFATASVGHGWLWRYATSVGATSSTSQLFFRARRQGTRDRLRRCSRSQPNLPNPLLWSVKWTCCDSDAGPGRIRTGPLLRLRPVGHAGRSGRAPRRESRGDLANHSRDRGCVGAGHRFNRDVVQVDGCSPRPRLHRAAGAAQPRRAEPWFALGGRILIASSAPSISKPDCSRCSTTR
jgi:hypothetical protein